MQSRHCSAVPLPHQTCPPHPAPQSPMTREPPWTTRRSPAESLARARLRGRAAGPDRLAGGRRAAVQGARLANLRSRSPSYVYLGHLTPALPAGRGHPLVGLPVGRWRWSRVVRSVHAGCSHGTVGTAAARNPRGPDRAAVDGGQGAVPSPLVAWAPHSLRPRPGAPPPQPLRARPRARGERGEGTREI